MKIHYDILSNHVIYDIETEAVASDELVRAINPPYPDFDPAEVKTGDCRTPEAAAEKIEKARAPHAEQELRYWVEKMEKRALMLVAARLRHISTTKRGERRYMDMAHLNELKQQESAS